MRNKLTPDVAPTRDGHSAGVTRVSKWESCAGEKLGIGGDWGLQVTRFPCWSEKQVAEGDAHLLLGLKN